MQTESGLFKIEIENKTYPHSGYAYLDLTKLNSGRRRLCNKFVETTQVAGRDRRYYIRITLKE
jgi:hypothetical protein